MSTPATSAPTPTVAPAASPDRPALEAVVKGVRFVCADGDVLGRQGTVGTSVTAHMTAMSRRHLLVDWRENGWHATLLPTARFETLLDGTPMVREGAVRLLPGTHRVSIEGTVFDLCVAAPESLSTELSAALNLPPGLKRLRKEFGGADGLLRLIAENVADLIAVIDHEGKRVWNNAAYFTCLGYSPSEINDSYSMAEIHPEDLPKVKDGFTTSMATGIGQRLEYRMRHRNGHWVHLESQGRVVESSALRTGKYLVLVARDVTARKEAEQRAEKRVQQLVARTDTLAQFTRSRSFQDGDVEKCFALVTEVAVRHFDGERADVWLFSDDGQTLRRAETFAQHASTTHDDHATLRADACPHFLAALRADRCVEAVDARTDERVRELYPPLLAGHGTASFLAARVGLGDELLGMLTLERTGAPSPWSLEDETFAASLADTLLMALHARRRAEAFGALQKSQRQNAADLAGAAAYVRALLPEPLLEGAVRSDWRFVPCEALGGDGFGHFWLDEDRLAIFLIDAVGHGVNAALLAISMMNILRSGSLPETDFHDPAAVLANLNAAFQMESQHNMFFTIWYGVWDRRSREIVFATAGHPPAVLFGPDKGAAPVTLGGKGLMIGGSPDAAYENARAAIPVNSRLYVFSDGAYELIDPEGNAWGFDAFLAQLGQPPPPGGSELDELQRQLVRVNGGRAELPDDFSILRLTFH